MEYLTNKNIFVCGMNRTGQHAISAWVMSSYDNALYKNNIGFGTKKGDDVPTVPVFRLKDTLRNKSFNYKHFKDGGFVGTGSQFLNYDHKDCRDLMVYGIEMATPEVFANGYKTCFPVKQIELIQELKNKNPEYSELKAIGKDNVFVFVLRSPWNHYSSGYFWRGSKHPIKKPKVFAETWVKYAEECLGITNFVGEGFVPVLYDKWFTDKDYRESLSEKIGIPFTDAGRDIVLNYGKGSTFQRKATGTKLNPLDRWKKCFKNETSKEALMNALYSDDRLIDYAVQLFGEVPFDLEKS